VGIFIIIILACVVLSKYRSVKNRQMGGQTDTSMITKTRLALHAIARKNHNKYDTAAVAV